MNKILYTLLFLCFPFVVNAVSLRENLNNAKIGDYLVTQQNKNYTVLIVREKKGDVLTIEEITIPSKRMGRNPTGWDEWVKRGAPKHTCWVMYAIDVPSGEMVHYYNYDQNQWYNIPEADNFLSKLLTLELHEVPLNDRKKMGAGKNRQYWQPKLIFEGQVVQGMFFDAYSTRWPRDGSELSNRAILIYLPQDNASYPTYFPYWLEIYGSIGKAKVRIVDSGRGLTSPMNIE